MFGNVWATNGLWGMFWDGVNGQNVLQMFESGALFRCTQKTQKMLPLPYACLHTVKQLCDVALNGCERSCRALVTCDNFRLHCALRCPRARFVRKCGNDAFGRPGAV